MKFMYILSSVMLALAAVSMVTNHQGLTQKIIQTVFFLLVIDIIFYIYKLRG